jgi:hypothetical protein
MNHFTHGGSYVRLYSVHHITGMHTTADLDDIITDEAEVQVFHNRCEAFLGNRIKVLILLRSP